MSLKRVILEPPPSQTLFSPACAQNFLTPPTIALLQNSIAEFSEGEACAQNFLTLLTIALLQNSIAEFSEDARIPIR